MQLIDEQLGEHYKLSREHVCFAEGPDKALKIKIKRNNCEANGWLVTLSRNKVVITAIQYCAFGFISEYVCQTHCYHVHDAMFEFIAVGIPLFW